MNLHFTDSDLISFTGTMWDEPLSSVAQELLQARQRVRKLEEMQRWIPVSERLPEVDKRVEIFGGFEQTTHIGYYREHATQWDSEDGGYWHGKNFGLITHWRPLPEPPEEK